MKRHSTWIGLAFVAAALFGQTALAVDWYHYGYDPGTCLVDDWEVKPLGYWGSYMLSAVLFTPQGHQSDWYTLEDVTIWVNMPSGIPAFTIQGFTVLVYSVAGGPWNPAPGNLVYSNAYAAETTVPQPDGVFVGFDLSDSAVPPKFGPNQPFIVAIEYFDAYGPTMGFCGDGFNGEPQAEYRNRVRTSGLTWIFTDGAAPPNNFTGDFIMYVTTEDAPPEVPAAGPFGLALLVAGLSLALGLRRRGRR